jgi:hypothetical protein
MATILELYGAQQSSLGVDKISYAAGINAKTPYTTNDLKKADEQVLTAEKFKTGRGGILNTRKYSEYTKKK